MGSKAELRDKVAKILGTRDSISETMELYQQVQLLDEIMGVVSDAFTQGWDLCAEFRGAVPPDELKVA